MDLARAEAIAKVAQTVVNSATVEVNHLKVTGQACGSKFLLPAPENETVAPGVKIHRLRG